MFLLQITMAVCVLTLAVCGSDREAAAQTMVTTTTPLQANSESFFESSGVGWSVRRPGFFASFNSGGPIPPPFGGFNPQAGIQSGFQLRNGPWTGNLFFNFAQGTQRFSSTTAPVLTSIPGQPASIFSGTTRPFVIGLQPIVPGRLGGGFGGSFGGPQFSIPSGAIYRPGNGLSPVRQAIANGFKPQNLGKKKEEKREPPKTATVADRSNAAFAFFGGKGGDAAASSTRTESTGTSAIIRTPIPDAPAVSRTQPRPRRVDRQPEIPPPTSLQEELADVYYRKGFKAEASRDLRTAEFYYRKALKNATGARQQRIQRRLNGLKF